MSKKESPDTFTTYKIIMKNIQPNEFQENSKKSQEWKQNLHTC